MRGQQRLHTAESMHGSPGAVVSSDFVCQRVSSEHHQVQRKHSEGEYPEVQSLDDAPALCHNPDRIGVARWSLSRTGHTETVAILTTGTREPAENHDSYAMVWIHQLCNRDILNIAWSRFQTKRICVRRTTAAETKTAHTAVREFGRAEPT